LFTRNSVSFYLAATYPTVYLLIVCVLILVYSRGSKGARQRKVSNITSVAAYLRTQASKLRRVRAILNYLYL